MAATRIAVAVLALLAVASAQNLHRASDDVAGDVIRRGPRALLTANTFGYGGFDLGKIDLHKLVDFKVMKEEKKEEKPKEIKIVVEKKEKKKKEEKKCVVKKQKKECEDKCDSSSNNFAIAEVAARASGGSASAAAFAAAGSGAPKKCDQKCVIKVYYELQKCDDCLEKKEECYCDHKKVSCKEYYDEKKVYYVETDKCDSCDHCDRH